MEDGSELDIAIGLAALIVAHAGLASTENEAEGVIELLGYAVLLGEWVEDALVRADGVALVPSELSEVMHALLDIAIVLLAAAGAEQERIRILAI